jgi:hypothetical protein
MLFAKSPGEASPSNRRADEKTSGEQSGKDEPKTLDELRQMTASQLRSVLLGRADTGLAESEIGHLSKGKMLKLFESLSEKENQGGYK